MTAIVAGATVTVHDPRGDWQGYVRQMPDGPYREQPDPIADPMPRPEPARRGTTTSWTSRPSPPVR